MFSLFKKFKDGLTQTAQSIAASVGGLFGLKPIDTSTLEKLVPWRRGTRHATCSVNAAATPLPDRP